MSGIEDGLAHWEAVNVLDRRSGADGSVPRAVVDSVLDLRELAVRAEVALEIAEAIEAARLRPVFPGDSTINQHNDGLDKAANIAMRIGGLT